MKFNLSKVEFSNKDIKNRIIIPTKLTQELAYFIGIHFGDGSMTFNKTKKNYNINYSGHIIDEYDFYTQDIAQLIKKIFNKDVKSYKSINQKGKWVNIYFYSKAISTFLNRVIGLPYGSKNNSSIPYCIKNSNLKIKSVFIKGLADTDFCLSFKKRDKILNYYPVISISTCNITLIKELNLLLTRFGFSITKILNYPTERNGKKLITNQININGTKAIDLWMSKIGFNSPKHLTKYLIWKKYGFCPPNTNLLQRKEILNGKLDIQKTL